jgi:beta-glucosidase
MIYAHAASHDPANQGRRYWDEASTPLYPFGYGLSYSGFSYGNLTLDRDHITKGETLHVAVDVTNTGERVADEVVQLYIHQRYGRAARPVRELKGFRRLTLQPGESRRIGFELGPGELRYWHPQERDWVLDSATFDVWVGGDSMTQLGTTFDTV